MPKIRTKHADIKAAAVAQADHSLGCGLVSHAQARRKVGEVVLHVSLKVDVSKTRHIDQAGSEVQPSPGTFACDRLGKINLPSQSIVEDQFASNAEGVLTIKEPPFLTFSCIVDAICIAVEKLHITKQESGQPQS